MLTKAQTDITVLPGGMEVVSTLVGVVRQPVLAAPLARDSSKVVWGDKRQELLASEVLEEAVHLPRTVVMAAGRGAIQAV